jgi:hypothetical protein
MHSDILNRTAVIFIIGDKALTEPICRMIAQKSPKFGHIPAKTLNHPQVKSGRTDTTTLLVDIINNEFSQGKRLFMVSGYPLTIEEAVAASKQFVHITSFSIEGDRLINDSVPKIRKILGERGQVHQVSQSRKPQTYIENRIEDFLIGANLASDARSLAVA